MRLYYGSCGMWCQLLWAKDHEDAALKFRNSGIRKTTGEVVRIRLASQRDIDWVAAIGEGFVPPKPVEKS